jgi:hypothetical protein
MTQEKTTQNSQTSPPSIDLPTALAEAGRHLGELLTTTKALFELANQILGSEAAVMLAGRVALLAQAAIIVPGIQTDHAGVAAMFGMGTKDGARTLLDRNQVPWEKPGESRLFQTSQVTTDFRPKEEEPPAPTKPAPKKKGS